MTDSPTPPIDPATVSRLKASAKALKKALAKGDADAKQRFAAVFGSRDRTGRLADCLHIVAREHGFESWPKLAFAAEAAALDRGERIARLNRALFEGQRHIVDRLLTLDPSLADAHLGIQIARYDLVAVQTALAKDPGAATRAIGPRTPILHLAFSQAHKWHPDRKPAMLAIAEALVAQGADVNDSYPAFEGSDHRLSALYGALGHAGNMELAAWLLDRGADPDDNESLYHSVELGHLDGVRLLMQHGVTVAHTNAFYRMLDFDNLEGARLFLDYGADPNEPIQRIDGRGPDDYGNALHHAIRRGRDGRFADLLIDAGADPSATCFGHTAFALARICNNPSMTTALEQRGLTTTLRPDEAFMAAAVTGDRATATELAQADPGMVERLHPFDRCAPVEIAKQPDRADILRLMHAVGFDMNQVDDSDMPALHGAAWFGRADNIEALIEFDPDLELENMFGGTALGTAIHGSANCPDAAAGDYERSVLLLLEAGARIRPDHGHYDMGTEEVLAVLEGRSGTS